MCRAASNRQYHSHEIRVLEVDLNALTLGQLCGNLAMHETHHARRPAAHPPSVVDPRSGAGPIPTVAHTGTVSAMFRIPINPIGRRVGISAGEVGAPIGASCYWRRLLHYHFRLVPSQAPRIEDEPRSLRQRVADCRLHTRKSTSIRHAHTANEGRDEERACMAEREAAIAAARPPARY
jgi:hypothetical protein